MKLAKSNLSNIFSKSPSRLQIESMFRMCKVIEKNSLLEKLNSFHKIKSTYNYDRILENLIQLRLPTEMLNTLSYKERKILQSICMILIGQSKKLYRAFDILRDNGFSSKKDKLTIIWNKMKLTSAKRIFRLYSKFNNFKVKDIAFQQWIRVIDAERVLGAGSEIDPRTVKRSTLFYKNYVEQKEKFKQLTSLGNEVKVPVINISKIEDLIASKIQERLDSSFPRIEDAIVDDNFEKFEELHVDLAVEILCEIGELVKACNKSIKKKRQYANQETEIRQDNPKSCQRITGRSQEKRDTLYFGQKVSEEEMKIPKTDHQKAIEVERILRGREEIKRQHRKADESEKKQQRSKSKSIPRFKL